jgi:uncharacterized protein YkwD
MKRISFVEIASFQIFVWLVILIVFQGVFYFGTRYGSTPVKISTPIVDYNIPSPIPQNSLRSSRDFASNITEQPVVIPAVPKEWGVAEQIDEVTWTIKLGEDAEMGTALEIYSALNAYRNRHGVGSLTWDDKLAEYARSRAVYFSSIESLDQHKGFIEYTNSEDNIRNLGFWGVGENSSFGFKLAGVHIIEWVFAGDEPHDKNQLEASWTHVGIGVDGVSVAVIFGKSKI